MSAQIKEAQSGCAESEPSPSWREYMAQNPGWQTERTPNVYAAGYRAGMKHPRLTPATGLLKEALTELETVLKFRCQKQELGCALGHIAAIRAELAK